MNPKVYPIVKYGDPVLEASCTSVTQFDATLEELAREMFLTMYAAQGIGLAAPQIGRNLRLAVIDITHGKDPNAIIVLVNPEVTHREGPEVRQEEGCLSVPGFHAFVTRPKSVTVKAQNLKGEPIEVTGSDLLARALCHEVDHLNGALYLRHVGSIKREIIRGKIKKLKKAGLW
jgi:peptide deformylase